MPLWIYNLLAIGLHFRGSHGLFSPAFVSDWQYMDSNDPSTTNPTIEHGLGILPVRVEVQVTSADSPYIFPGVGSAYNDNDFGSRGGVIYIYNVTHVRLFGATNNGSEIVSLASGEGYLTYTGETTWTPEASVKSTTGYVRVRVWHPDDFPPPTKILNTSITAGSWTTHKELLHDLGTVPNFTIVQYTARHIDTQAAFWGWTMEGQGSSSREYSDTNALNWGGLMFGVNASVVRLWVPNYHLVRPGGVFSYCDGWGEYIFNSGTCTYLRAHVRISMWMDMEALIYHTRESTHLTTETTGTHVKDIPFPFDVDKDLIVMMTEADSWKNNGFRFYGSGAVMTNLNCYSGGLVYGYTKESARFWHPLGTANSLIHVKGVGGTVNNQNSTSAKIVLQVWKYDPCLRTPTINVNNAYHTLVASGDNCKAVYTCHNESFIHIGGEMTRMYYNNNRTWDGEPPICSLFGTTTTEGPTTLVTQPKTTTSYSYCCNMVLYGINAHVITVVMDNGCLATYTCITGYTRVVGDTVLAYDGTLEEWNGTALECYVLCDTIESGINASHTILSPNGKDTLLAGTVITYTCYPGFTLASGDVIRACTFSGNWTGTRPLCVEVISKSTVQISPPTTTAATSLMPSFPLSQTASNYVTNAPTSVPLICFNNGTPNATMANAITVALELVKNLTIDAKSTSRYQRTLICVHDERTSAVMIGTTGAIICISVICLTLASDMLNLTPGIRTSFRMGGRRKK